MTVNWNGLTVSLAFMKHQHNYAWKHKESVWITACGWFHRPRLALFLGFLTWNRTRRSGISAGIGVCETVITARVWEWKRWRQTCSHRHVQGVHPQSGLSPGRNGQQTATQSKHLRRQARPLASWADKNEKAFAQNPAHETSGRAQFTELSTQTLFKGSGRFWNWC